LLFNLPASPFSVEVTGGATNNLGAITWTPSRVGPTVFEIGYPDRTAWKFRHGDDYWVGDIGPSPTEPSPIWSKFLEYPFDFPNGPNYTVGQSRWTTDWNFIQPVVTDSAGNFDDSASTITFNLASAPTSGAQASLYLGLASDFYAALIVSVNGNNLGGVSGVTGIPNSNNPTTGYYAGYSDSDTSVREGINAVFSDERLTFPASLLNAGTNTITVSIRQTGDSDFADHAMYDYIRLELTGYVPPPPASVAAYAGDNCNLICWLVTPGATSYNVFSTTTSGSNYVSIASGVTGPVCGSGFDNATWLDTNTINGTTYYYVVQSVNPTGHSTNSPQSAGATPSTGMSTSAPVAPAGLTVTNSSHQSVTLNWSASPGANFYSVWRSTLFNNLGGASNTLGTIILDNTNTATSYTDTSPTDGSIYSYFVTATGAGGTSGNSASVVAVPLPAPPASAPASLTGTFVQSTNIILNWSAGAGAVGYIISRATSPGGPFNYVMSITETTYPDIGLSTNTTYYYQVMAVNAGGVSTNALLAVLGPPVAPGLTAIAGNAQVTLIWSVEPGATNYVLRSSSTNGGPYTTILNTTNTSYENTGLINGTSYYYVVYSQGPNGQSPLSAQASATPSVAVGGIYWTNNITASAQSWNVNANWVNAAAFPNGTKAVAFVTSPIAANQTINLNQAVTVGSLSLGASGGAFTLAANGGTLTLDNTPGTASLIELSTSKGDTISAPMTVNGSLLVTNTSANTFNVSGNIAGAASGLTVNGNVTLSGTNTYTGGTILNSGQLVFSAGTAIPSSGTLTLNNTGTVAVTTANSLPNVLVNGTNAITGNGLSGTGIATLDDAGILTLFVSGGSDVFDLTGTMTGSGNLVLGSSPMTLRFNGTTGDGNAVFNLGAGTAVANVRYTITTAIALGGLAGGSATQLQGDNSSGGANMTYTIGGAGANTEFDGTIANGTVGATAVAKTGAGILTLTGANTYSGGTTILGGALLVNNLGGSGAGSGLVTVAAGGALGGTGVIFGPVTVNSGGALAPGNPLGSLTISNSLTLSAGATTFIRVQHSPLTNNSVTVSGALTQGGALNVTNSGLAALSSGDSFKLFGATNYSGSFAGFLLPPLTSGLVWNTNLLNVSGILSVAAYLPPTIGQSAIVGANLFLSGSGGIPCWTYYVLASTNLAPPAAPWTPVATNQFDAGGNFSLTLSNVVTSNQPQKFYQLQLQ